MIEMIDMIKLIYTNINNSNQKLYLIIVFYNNGLKEIHKLNSFFSFTDNPIKNKQ